MTPTKEPRLEKIETHNHDQLTHIIRKEDHYKGYVLGQAVEALCGKKWIPSRDPELFEVCQSCADIHERMVNAT